jgi:radical SAM superfamily enzyme YgiQ (UPF0313 family)
MTYKILLISPPIFDYYYTPARMEPLGLYYIKKSLDEIEGVQADIYDAVYSGKKKAVKKPDEFSYLEEIYKEDYSAFSLFNKYYRFGDSFDKIISLIKDNNYSLAGISSLFSAYHPDVENLIYRIKTETNAKAAIGGWAVSSEPEFISKTTYADYIIPENPELNFKKLAEVLIAERELHHSGKIFHAGKGTAVCPDEDDKFSIEDYPLRDRPYFFRNRRIAKMILSRGCVNRCGFCSVHSRYKYQARSIDSIKNEIDYLHNEGVQLIDFEDDNLFNGKDFSEGLLSVLKFYSLKGMAFTAMNGITASNLMPYVEEALDSGFIEFNLSMATGNEKTLSDLSRPDFTVPVKYIAEKNAGRVDISAFLIAGMPGTDVNDLLNDIIYLAALPLKIGFSPLYIIPGARIFKDFGIPENRRLTRGSALYKFGKGFNRYDIASYWKLVRIINALKTAQNPETLEEDIFYFRKSISEKSWYHKNKNFTWNKGFSFSCEFPGKINIISMKGKQLELSLK